MPINYKIDILAALKEKGVPFEMHIFPFGHHGLGLATATKDVAKWAELSVEWIKNNF